jgi:hypothetical protein
MKTLRNPLFVLGILLFSGGLTLFINNEISSRGLILGDDAACSTTDKEQIKLEELVKQYDAGKGTPEEIRLQFEVENQIKIADRWSKACGTGKSWARFRFTGFLSVTIIGFLLLITVFFTGRKKQLV